MGRARRAGVRVVAGLVIGAALLLLADAGVRVATYAAWRWDLRRFPQVARRLDESAGAPVWDLSLLDAPIGRRLAPVLPPSPPPVQPPEGPPLPPPPEPRPAWVPWDAFPASAFPRPPATDRPAPGTVRVACIGDSTTYSGYPDALATLLDQRFGPGRVEVLNLGAQAADLESVRLLVQRFLPGWHADLAIAYLGRNDLVFDVARARADRARDRGLPVTADLAFGTHPRSVGLCGLLAPAVDPLGDPGDVAAIDAAVDARVATDLDALVAAIRAAGARPWLSTLAAPSGPMDPADRAAYDAEIAVLWPSLGDFAGYARRVAAFDAAVREAGRRRNVPVLDVAAGIVGSRGVFADICHLDGDGVKAHAALAARALAPAIEAMLAARTGAVRP